MVATYKKNIKKNTDNSKTNKNEKNKVVSSKAKEIKSKTKAKPKTKSTNTDKKMEFKQKQVENKTKKNDGVKNLKSVKKLNNQNKSEVININKNSELKQKKDNNKTKKTAVAKKKTIKKVNTISKTELNGSNKNKKSEIKSQNNNNKTKKVVGEKSSQLIRKYSETQPLFSKKCKKYLIVVAIICAIILFLEFGYFVYQKVSFDSKNIYYDTLNSLVIDDSDIVAVGSSNFKYSKYNSYTSGLEKAKLVKYDINGKILFEKMYDKGINTVFNSILSIDDGYIVVGSGVFSKEEQESEGREAFIIKYDKDGNFIWEKYYQVVTNTGFNKVIATNDGYVAIGQSIYANMEMGNHTTGGGIIVKYDKEGNEIWCNNHGGMKSGNFNDIVEVNGDFYVVGKDATDSANLVKFNANGEYEWHKNYSYTDSIGFSGIAYLNNYLYVVGSKKVLAQDIGDDDNRDTTNTDGLLVKYDLDGKKIFEKVFGGSNYERYNSIIAHRSNLYVVGHTTSADIGFKITTDGKVMTGLVLCYDEEGNINKKEIFGGSNNDNLTDVVTDGGSLYITGYSNSDDGNMVTSFDNGKDYFGKIIQIDYRFRTKMVK